MSSNSKPHAIVIPFPAQSHIKAMLKMARLLHSRGFCITFVNTDLNHARILETGSQVHCPGFCFMPLLDGLSPEVCQDLNSVFTSIRRDFFGLLRNLIDKINGGQASEATEKAFPPVTCIVSDGLMTFSTGVAEEHGIPVAMLFTISACAFMGIRQFRALKDRGIFPLKEESYLTNGYLDTTLDWIPGMKDIRLKDLPALIRTTDPDDILFNGIMECAENAPKATMTILHTFDALEAEILNALSSSFPSLHAIGPLELLQELVPDSSRAIIDYSPFKEDTECLEWLDSKETRSVIYVSIGSVAVPTQEQLIELGMGLALSKYDFLWAIRPDLVVGESSCLPPKFEIETKGRGFITSWCSQVRVLNHPSIGGFLTHYGWNSILESIVAGVAMLCWPFLGDQQTNCRYCCREWKIGMEMNDNVTRDKVARLVNKLMEGVESKLMKDRIIEWKHIAMEAISPHGSSTTNFEKLLRTLLESAIGLP